MSYGEFSNIFIYSKRSRNARLILYFYCIFGFLTSANCPAIDFANQIWPVTCTSKTAQSPVDFPRNQAFYFYSDTLGIINTYYSATFSSYAIRSSAEKIGYFGLNGAGYITFMKDKQTADYSLTDIYLYTPSEHSFDDIQSQIEIQFVHKSSSNSILIISLLFDNNATVDNPDLAGFQFTLSGTLSNLRLSSLIKTTDYYYFYEGSTTDSSCAEPVNWVVFNTPYSMSKSQFNGVYKFIINAFPYGNNRPVQLYNRRLTYKTYYSNFLISDMKNRVTYLHSHSLLLLTCLLLLLTL